MFDETRHFERFEPEVVVRGDVEPATVAYARDKLLAVLLDPSGDVISAQLVLERHADPARERPFHVALHVDLNGTPVRAHRHAATMHEAIDCAVDRLQRRIVTARARPRALRLRHRDESSWHHGDEARTA